MSAFTCLRMISNGVFDIRKQKSKLVFILLILALGQTGCRATCKRVEKDRIAFFSRQAIDGSPHIEAIAPFELAEKLINSKIERIEPMNVKLPIEGELGSYFGKIDIQPTKIHLLPASKGYLRFKLDFNVQTNGKTAFSMSVETDVKPTIDLETGKLEIGFDPKIFGALKPKLSKDAKEDLGKIIYDRIPKIARAIIPKTLVDKVAANVVKRMVSSFYEHSKDKLLPKLGMESRVVINLPKVPVKKLAFDSFAENGGGIRLLFYSGLAVKKGIDEKNKYFRIVRKDQLSVRMSGSTAAELFNWAITEGLVPSRYDKKGKPKKDGELQPGLDWIPGKRPMKVYLWQDEKPCKRIVLGAKPSVSVEADKIKIKAEDMVIENVEASALTELGVWFYSLWKDAVDVRKSAASKMSFQVGDKKMVTRIERADIENDEIMLGIGIANY